MRDESVTCITGQETGEKIPSSPHLEVFFIFLWSNSILGPVLRGPYDFQHANSLNRHGEDLFHREMLSLMTTGSLQVDFGYNSMVK